MKLVHRFYGGAVLNKEQEIEPSMNAKHLVNMEEKKKGFSIFKLLFFVLIIACVVFLVSTLLQKDTGGGSSTVNNDPDDKDFFTDYFSGSGSTYSSNWKLTSNIG